MIKTERLYHIKHSCSRRLTPMNILKINKSNPPRSKQPLANQVATNVDKFPINFQYKFQDRLPT